MLGSLIKKESSNDTSKVISYFIIQIHSLSSPSHTQVYRSSWECVNIDLSRICINCNWRMFLIYSQSWRSSHLYSLHPMLSIIKIQLRLLNSGTEIVLCGHTPLCCRCFKVVFYTLPSNSNSIEVLLLFDLVLA